MDETLSPFSSSQEPSSKHEQILGECSIDPDDNPNATKITDLNDYCIVKIFDYLSAIDVLNVTDTSERLLTAAELWFTAERRTERVRLQNIHRSIDRSIQIGENETVVSGLKTCLRFIRRFGRFIFSLNLYYSNADVVYRGEIIHYVSQYCGDTLEMIAMHHVRGNDLSQIQKPFSKVQKLSFAYCHLEFPRLADFGEWFPSMSSLHFVAVSVVDRRCFQMHFPSLKRLSINMITYISSYVVELMRMNPQIHFLDLIGADDLNATLLQRAADYLKSLESLRIVNYGPDIPRHPLPFASSFQASFTDNAIHFIANLKSLKELILVLPKAPDYRTMVRFTERLSNLTSLSSVEARDIFSVDQIISLLTQCESLKYMSFSNGIDHSKYNSLEESLPNDWQLTSGGLDLVRKIGNVEAGSLQIGYSNWDLSHL